MSWGLYSEEVVFDLSNCLLIALQRLTRRIRAFSAVVALNGAWVYNS